MIVLDVNVLLYAYHEDSAQHRKARICLEELFSGASRVGLPWHSVISFFRISTTPRLPGSKPAADVVRIIESWLQQPNVRLLSPGDEHWSLLREMIIQGQGHGPLVSDAHLAALTIEHGGVLYTTDRDFARFPDLRWKNPLI